MDPVTVQTPDEGTNPSRRAVLARGVAAVGAIAALQTGFVPVAVAADRQANFAVDGPFRRSTVSELARRLAAEPYKAPASALPEVLDKLNYDQYRDIRFNPEAAVWADRPLPFRMQLFHRGLYYKDPVEVALVENGEARHFAYDPDLFTIGPLIPTEVPRDDIGFAGIRLHGPINRPDYFDEVAVFLGASYFRSLGEGQVYGLSARGLAIKTADPEGEEFPAFRAFWVETPVQGSETIVVHALLDSPSTAGAYRFTIRPGNPTAMDVEAQLFPRVDLNKVGFAPGTSMYLFSPSDRLGVDDFRPAVHDSDGLLMVTGRGDRLWRPLANPQELQISAFSDISPRGFGLIQRERAFTAYEDLEAAYERRPSLWVEPIGDWGTGAVTLIEIPTDSEVHDNIVAYWAPREVIPAGSEYSLAYRLSWGGDPAAAIGPAVIASTRSGRATVLGPTPERIFVIDFAFTEGVDRVGLGQATATVSASKGVVENVVVQDNAQTGGVRLTFQLDPANEPLIELRAELAFANGQKAETWVYRWTV